MSTTAMQGPAAVADLAEYVRTRDPELRAEILDAYSGLADAMAARFSNGADSIEDLRQEAAIGLIKALDRFDPDRQVAFTTYAWATISGQLKRYLRDRCWRVRVPRGVQDVYLRARDEREHLRVELARDPTPAELAARCRVDAAELGRALQVASAQRPSSLDAGTDSGSAHDVVGSSDRSLDRVIDRQILVQLLETLSDRERRILALHYIGGLSQTEVGARIGISQVQVSRLLHHGLRRLRAAARDSELWTFESPAGDGTGPDVAREH